MSEFEAFDATLSLDVTVTGDEGDWLVVNSSQWIGGPRRVRASCVTPTGETVAERVEREARDDYDRFERPREMNE